MSTGTAIVQDALQLIGSHSTLSPAAPESIAVGLRNLNAMLESWLSRNIRIGINPLEVVGDELGEPADARNAIVEQLALVLAPNFDNGTGSVVSRDLKASAARDFGHLCTLYQEVSVPAKVISSTAPLGQGNIRTFAG